MPENAPKQRSPMTLEEQIRHRYKDSILGRWVSPKYASLQIGTATIHYDRDEVGGKLRRTIVPNGATFSPTELSVFAAIAKEAMDLAAEDHPMKAAE